MRREFLLAAVVVAPFIATSSAEAGIPIPCTATRFLKASEVSTVVDAEGRRVIPYYNVFGCSAGKWDGYMSSDGKYNNLTPAVTTQLPPAPTFWTAAWQSPGRFWVEWLWMVVGFFVVMGTALASLAGSETSNAANQMPSARARRT